MTELKSLSMLKTAGRLRYWRGTIEIPESVLHAICDEIQAEHERAIATTIEIVRCRDCIHSHEDRRNAALGWIDVLVCDSEQWSTLSLMPSHKVKPDGFCAWGEHKVVD